MNTGPTIRLVGARGGGGQERIDTALRTMNELFQTPAPTGRPEAGAHQPPAVRLAWFDIPAVNNTLAAPEVRLALNGPRLEHAAKHGEDGILNSGLGHPAVRLAHQPGSQCDNSTKQGGWNGNGAPAVPPHHAPALLVSYYYVKPFLKNREAYCYRDWVMDSGAFSAHNSGVEIDLSEYVDCCLSLMATDPTMTEVFALDQIPKSGSPKDVADAAEVSARNTEEMWRQGVPAIPCFHCGEPEELLYDMAGKYPKVALGGMVAKGGGILSQDQKFAWLEQCFARVWPKKFHGFGVSAERMVFGLPFHSVDATNWEIGPCAFGNWQKFGTMSVRGSNQDLRSQVKHYLDMEHKARVRWAKEMALLDSLDADPATSWHSKAKQAEAAFEAARKAGPPPPKPESAAAPATKKRTPAQPAEKKAEEPAKSGMDPKWDDYWKNRL